MITTTTLALTAAVLAQSPQGQVGVDPGSMFIDSVGIGMFATPPRDLPGHDHGRRELPEGERPELEDEWLNGEPWWMWSAATGNWGELRMDLDARGITFAGSYTGEIYAVATGGVNQESGFLSLLDGNVTFDLDAIAGIPGAMAFVDFYSVSGDNPSDDLGDLQGVSNIETARSRDQFAEVWYQQNFADDAVRVRVGKIDANEDFAMTDALGHFINSSAGFSPTIIGMTTFPDPAFGVSAFFDVSDNVSIGGGFFDGAASVDGVPVGSRGPSTFFDDDLSDDYFLIGEVDLEWGGGEESSRRGRVAAGGWYHTGDWVRFDAGIEDGTWGLFVVGEYELWSREDGTGAIALAAQYGYADGEVSAIEQHGAIGLVQNGPFAARPNDSAGFYVSHAFLSDESMLNEDETAFEGFYEFQLTPFFSVKPDVQWVLNPAGDPASDDALLVGMRFEISF